MEFVTVLVALLGDTEAVSLRDRLRGGATTATLGRLLDVETAVVNVELAGVSLVLETVLVDFDSSVAFFIDTEESIGVLAASLLVDAPLAVNLRSVLDELFVELEAESTLKVSVELLEFVTAMGEALRSQVNVVRFSQ